MASADIGGLGARNGAPVTYNWVLPSVTPLLIPWLAILVLLALKPNRRAAAWLIWLPLAVVMLVTQLPQELPSDAGFLLDAIVAMALGLAAVWLLANYLCRSHRLLTFLCVLLALAFFSALAFASRQGLESVDEGLQIAGIVLAVGALASTIALTLAGWICRKRYRPLGIYLWLLVLLAGVWLLVAAPFYVYARMASPFPIPLSEFLLPVLAVAVGNFVLLLPFVILSSANPFFRERFKTLLHVRPDAPPVWPETNLKT